MTELKCTNYEMYDDWEDAYLHACHCPVCGGFLKWVEMQPICNKCGTELLAIPDRDEGEEMEWGKICPISKPGKREAEAKDE